MSDEDQVVEVKITLPVALFRIAVGITFGSIVIGILFTVWALSTYGSGPVIGTLVFEFISVSAIMYIGVVLIMNKIPFSHPLYTLDIHSFLPTIFPNSQYTYIHVHNST